MSITRRPDGQSYQHTVPRSLHEVKYGITNNNDWDEIVPLEVSFHDTYANQYIRGYEYYDDDEDIIEATPNNLMFWGKYNRKENLDVKVGFSDKGCFRRR